MNGEKAIRIAFFTSALAIWGREGGDKCLYAAGCDGDAQCPDARQKVSPGAVPYVRAVDLPDRETLEKACKADKIGLKHLHPFGWAAA